MKLHIHYKPYKRKPTEYETAKITNEIVQYLNDITIEQLASEIEQGKTFTPATFRAKNGKLSKAKSCWASQHLVCLDFDNEREVLDEKGRPKRNNNGKIIKEKCVTRTIDQALNDFKDNAAFIYSTFSHTSKHPKFRVVLVLDREITDLDEMDKIFIALKDMYPDADRKCFEHARLFYGGNRIYRINLNQTISADSLIRYYEKNIIHKNNGVTISTKNLLSSAYCNPSTSSSDHSDIIKNQDVKQLQRNIKIKPIVHKFNNKQDIYNFLKTQDLREYLGVSSSGLFHCLFHDDSTPSANIVINKDTGHQVYYCHGCVGTIGTIIDCTELLQPQNTTPDVINFLRKVYRVEFEQTDWQVKQKEIYEENKQRLLNTNELENIYPQLYKRIRQHIPDLVLFHEIAKNYIVTENFTDKNGQAIFYKDLEGIAKVFGKSKNKVKDKLAIFAYIGLVNKCGKKDIPHFLFKKSEELRKQKQNKYMVSYYSIPSYTASVLRRGELQAKRFKELGYTMKA